jgi:hypothetical protein
MAAVAERMKAMRARRNARGVREIRLTAPDARSTSVRDRIAAQCASLKHQQEDAAMAWVEAVSEFDEPGFNAAR